RPEDCEAWLNSNNQAKSACEKVRDARRDGELDTPKPRPADYWTGTLHPSPPLRRPVAILCLAWLWHQGYSAPRDSSQSTALAISRYPDASAKLVRKRTNKHPQVTKASWSEPLPRAYVSSHTKCLMSKPTSVASGS